ncbi:VWA domain-containing protein [Bifidobacterium myosotis]|uniref:VWA domain-containing protein n=1 Tax=Bifidobacterium myosotis TaxID=1630166 RepID=A0A261FLU1_9BIFI|nr:vWA domain-containing protein [Bifidobacterium myosotis]OZG60131.1 VWA domain-containing protein [Bifidobacterium myosotis]
MMMGNGINDERIGNTRNSERIGGNDRTELVFVVDRSGSMGGLESDTIGGFNGMLAKQRAIPGDCSVTTVLFDNRLETLHDHINLHAVGDLTPDDYWVRGSTALLDAVGSTIDRVVAMQRHTAAPYRADYVLFVIITDGYENASRRYSLAKVRRMIEHEREKCHWEFVFLGANIDAVQTADEFGIAPECAADFHADGQGVQASFAAVACAATAVRHGHGLATGAAADALRGVREDYRSRSRR